MPEEDDNAIKDKLGDRDGLADALGGGTTVSGSDADDDDDDVLTRNRPMFPMYIDERTQERVNDRFRKFNARRELDDKPQVEKNKHFFEGLLQCALDNDWEEYVEATYNELEE